MFCRSCNILLRLNLKAKFNIPRYVTNSATADPAPLFFNPEVQQLLKKLTRVDMKKVFRTRKIGHRLKEPQYKFLTTEELNKLMAETEERADKKLQMPPVVKARSEEVQVLSPDYELQGMDDSKYVFTDISYGASDRERLIVVRDPNGVLRKANSEERHRMTETYFPVRGRKIRMPHMFEKEYLQRLLDREEYEFILDRACLQFEPDDPMYQSITATTYNAVDEAQHYEALRSTRHFGPLAFHLAWNNNIDNLLLDLIQNDRLDEAVALVVLHHKLHPDAKSANTKLEQGREREFLQRFVEGDAKKKAALELSLQANAELHRQREETEAAVRRAHGQT